MRFGEIPEGGRSYNYRDERQEEGLSVYDAMFDENGSYMIIAGNGYLRFGAATYSNRPAYKVSGKLVGEGTDGEPLLVNIYDVSALPPDAFSGICSQDYLKT